ncbi:MAG TPA: molybdopterin-binding/glycosyltransferase family 2 protein [Xanthobacteraceae bacterium]|nr:molybdopterin-binding/glycosyltransferase family 2 protein [Xanthobacteraceae bacterium]
MKFGPLAIADAKGAIAAHSVRAGGKVVRKGTVVSEADIDALRVAGISEIVAARLEPGDVPEDEAATALARAVAGKAVSFEPAFTGRSNLYAEGAGVLLIDDEGVKRLNRVDEAVTFATLPAYRAVRAGEMIGTIKIIPFAVAGEIQRAALAAAKPLISVAPFKLKRVALVSTQLPGLADKVIDKTVRVTAARLAPMEASVLSDQRVPHAVKPLSASIKKALAEDAELVIVFGASAIADRRDVIPAAIEDAGGRIEHFGMPVDPGNLMLIGAVGGTPVIGAPGCARSPKENGFDWLLARLVAGLPVRRDDVTALGVGGLLMEIVTRPQPRASAPESPHALRLAAIVLAAGRGTRMGPENKLLAELNNKPIVRHTVEAALASRARPVIVVTGHEGDRVAGALKGFGVSFVRNPRFADGLSTSLRAGLAALSPEVDAVAVVLGDMPEISGALIDRLAAAIDPVRGALIAVPTRDGKRGNPVVWSRRLFDDLAHLEGDVGARHLIGLYADAVVEVPVEDEAVFTDVDTPEALAKLRNRR